MPMPPNENVTGRNHGGPGDPKYDRENFMPQNRSGGGHGKALDEADDRLAESATDFGE